MSCSDAVFCAQSFKKKKKKLHRHLASSLSWCSAICNVTVSAFYICELGHVLFLCPPLTPWTYLFLCFLHCMTIAVFPHSCLWEHSLAQSQTHSSHSNIWRRNEEISEYCLVFDIVYNFIRVNHKVYLLCWEFACVTKKELPVSLNIILGSYVWLLSILFLKINILFIW